ncbi:MarR family transcriptional regulator, partial [Priestia megaterium]|uniref:MarR family transcriptional regulator n=1 Tax=Priestia megaterium TaxID=1404 RepID=UPI0027896B43
MKKFSRKVSEAGKNARMRDLEREKDNQLFSQDELDNMNEMQQRAQSRGMIVIPEKRIKNRDRFVQMNQINMAHLSKIKYFENKEKILLLDIAPYVGIESNCLVHDVEAKVQVPLTLTELAEKLGRGKNNISPIVNSLIDKG